MGGSVPCPSCKGTGRIPKEMEETLVALIPLNDDRLKPKRTWFWVLIGIAMCTLLASGAIFMLVPRAVDLHSNRPAINIIHVTEHKSSPPMIRFHFMVSTRFVFVEYCQAPFSRLTSLYVNMQFDIVVALVYFNHREQVSLSTTQQVCCVPSGNCTST
ncbi:hypothetical protein ANCCEY_02123 [Ancylostoma ceylanicum]|uniref:Transmembrane protein 106 N-terminal domain-containing protein n=1 Tax=Ancylostoma ceylanicum TaxID=53326 RepID=A0A0D6M5E7_9BILA|nr:hypothetical protein ANCCEY_02123 [Ancylostoma ceylanicum]